MNVDFVLSKTWRMAYVTDFFGLLSAFGSTWSDILNCLFGCALGFVVSMGPHSVPVLFKAQFYMLWQALIWKHTEHCFSGLEIWKDFAFLLHSQWIGLLLHSSRHLISNQRLCANRWSDSKEHDGFEPPRSIVYFYLLTANWEITGSQHTKRQTGLMHIQVNSCNHTCRNEMMLKLYFTPGGLREVREIILQYTVDS